VQDSSCNKKFQAEEKIRKNLHLRPT